MKRNNFLIARRLEREKMVMLKALSRRFQDIFTKANVCWEAHTEVYHVATYYRR